jgi:TonB family protein
MVNILKRDIKNDYPIHIRIALLITLTGWIMAFIFTPKTEIKSYTHEKQPEIRIDNILPPKIKNISPPPQKPKLPVAAESDKEIEDITINPNINIISKTPEVDFELPDTFIPYDKKPEPLNLNEIKIEYPEIALKLRIEGTVWLKLWVDKNGNVRKVKVHKGVNEILDSVAVEAYRHLKFSPAMQRDIPVDVWITMPLTFKMKK